MHWLLFLSISLFFPKKWLFPDSFLPFPTACTCPILSLFAFSFTSIFLKNVFEGNFGCGYLRERRAAGLVFCENTCSIFRDFFVSALFCLLFLCAVLQCGSTILQDFCFTMQNKFAEHVNCFGACSDIESRCAIPK